MALSQGRERDARVAAAHENGLARAACAQHLRVGHNVVGRPELQVLIPNPIKHRVQPGEGEDQGRLPGCELDARERRVWFGLSHQQHPAACFDVLSKGLVCRGLGGYAKHFDLSALRRCKGVGSHHEQAHVGGHIPQVVNLRGFNPGARQRLERLWTEHADLRSRLRELGPRVDLVAHHVLEGWRLGHRGPHGECGVSGLVDPRHLDLEALGSHVRGLHIERDLAVLRRPALGKELPAHLDSARVERVVHHVQRPLDCAALVEAGGVFLDERGQRAHRLGLRGYHRVLGRVEVRAGDGPRAQAAHAVVAVHPRLHTPCLPDRGVVVASIVAVGRVAEEGGVFFRRGTRTPQILADV